MKALPAQTLYASSTQITGHGFDEIPYESLLGLHRAGILRRAILFGNYTSPFARWPVKNLRWHPVQMLSLVKGPYHHDARQRCLDSTAARLLTTGKFDLFLGWSGECVKSLRVARRLGIPSILEIPTWHRGRVESNKERTAPEPARFYKRWLNALLIGREQALEEYELADLLLVVSECAAESFIAEGIPREKLFLFSRGVDVERFTPLKPPPVFRAIFVGPPLKRKGVHHLLEAWHRLKLDNAELLLAGQAADDIKPYVRAYAGGNTKLLGEVEVTAQLYQQCSLHIFPSTREGGARSTYEAAACGLPQITTRESGDVVVDGLNGLVVPCENADALAAAIEKLYHNPQLRAQMGEAARKRVVENFTWDHVRERLLVACRTAVATKTR